MSNSHRKRMQADAHNYDRWLRQNTVGQRRVKAKRPDKRIVVLGASLALVTALSMSSLVEVNNHE